MTAGSLAKILAGRRNQKSPTPMVKNVGKIKDRRVRFFLKPSFKDQLKRIRVNNPNPPIVKSLNRFSTKRLTLKALIS